jgi:Ca2+-binding RTX toxin-like protein
MPGVPESDPADYEVYAGPKRQFLGLVDWVAPDGPRDELRRVGSALDAGSGQAIENDYLETAVIADLPYPPDPARPTCNTGSVLVAGRCANLHVGSNLSERLAGTARGDRIVGLPGKDRIGAGRGADCVRGGSGADRIAGGPGADVLNGGPAADVISSRGGGVDVLRCGGGDDRVSAGREDRVGETCERVRTG